MGKADATWIAVDWGTSRLRAWALGPDNETTAAARSDDGMNSLAPDQFEPALLALIETWLNSDRTTPVIACGMVGARQGWVEAAYRMLPAAPVSPGGMTVAPANDGRIKVSIIPGLARNDPADVMRGEETQIAGLLDTLGGFTGTVCMPGTHSKWVKVNDDVVTDFTTCMTGELFSLLGDHSILRHSLATGGFDHRAFGTAVDIIKDRPQEAMARLFSVRADDLLNKAPGDVARARLSAWLIMAEVHAMARFHQDHPVIIVGDDELARLYGVVLKANGTVVEVADGAGLTLRGLIRARQLSETQDVRDNLQ